MNRADKVLEYVKQVGPVEGFLFIQYITFNCDDINNGTISQGDTTYGGEVNLAEVELWNHDGINEFFIHNDLKTAAPHLFNKDGLFDSSTSDEVTKSYIEKFNTFGKELGYLK